MIRTLLFVLFVGVIVIGIVMLIVANKDAMMTPKKKGVITVNDKVHPAMTPDKASELLKTLKEEQ